MPLPVSTNEPERLDAVDRLNILDTEPEAAFDRIAEVAQQAFGVQGAAVSIVEEERQWFKATCGLSLDETPREQSFCTHVIEGDGVMVVEDARADPRFQGNPLIEEEGIRFYAGAPLVVDDRLRVGTLCLTDPAPRSFGEEDRALLAHLAGVATDLLEARLQTYETSYLTSALEQVDEPVSIIEGNPEAPSDARLAWANEAYAARSGTTRPALDGTRPWIFENLAAGSEAEDRVCRALNTGESVRGETSGRRENGELGTFAWVLAPVRDDEQITHWVIVQRDVTERKNREEEVRRSRERWRQLAESHRDPIQITVGETIQYVNPAGATLYGASDPDEIVGRSVLEFVPDDDPSDRSNVGRAMQTRREALRRDGESPPLEYEIRRLDGERRVVEFYSVLIRYKGQKATQTVVRDVTEQRLREAQLKHEATHDQLTGLLRNSDLRKRIRWALTNPGERDGALLYIDLDRFKEVNDNFGHHVGDAVLIEVADRLHDVVRETDAVGRAGGDEFVIWSSPLPDKETAVTLARRVAETLRRPYEVEDHSLQIGASVGLVTDGSEYTDVESLIQNADAAMYRAKTSPTQSVVRHGSPRGEEDDLSLEAAIRRGVERDAFEPFLLPVVRLDDGALTGFEVLARWRRENGHLAAPDTFLDVAEDTGMIVPIGRRVIEDACRGLQSLRENKTLDLSMTLSGNFSRQEFFRDETCNFIRRLLDTYDLSPSDFTMEITERIVENGAPDDTAVAKLKSLGINIEVDDLGTGYSSLHSLLKFPADGLKIDKELTAKVASSDAAHAIAQSVIDMAQSLDLHVTAEGIETAEQLSVLRDLGCQYGQGYLFSEPVPVGEAEALAHTFPRDLSSP